MTQLIKLPDSTQKLITSLENDQVITLVKQAREINFEVLVSEKKTNLNMLKATLGEQECTRLIAKMFQLYLEFIGITDLTPREYTAFAYEFLNNNPIYSLEDVINFFTFMKENQSDNRIKIYGKLTLLKLNEILGVYAERRTEALEIYHARLKEKISGPQELRSGLTSLDKVKKQCG